MWQTGERGQELVLPSNTVKRKKVKLSNLDNEGELTVPYCLTMSGTEEWREDNEVLGEHSCRTPDTLQRARVKSDHIKTSPEKLNGKP